MDHWIWFSDKNTKEIGHFKHFFHKIFCFGKNIVPVLSIDHIYGPVKHKIGIMKMEILTFCNMGVSVKSW